MLIYCFLHSKWNFAAKYCWQKEFSKFLLHLCPTHLIIPPETSKVNLGWFNHRVVHKEFSHRKRYRQNPFPTCPNCGKWMGTGKKGVQENVTFCLFHSLVDPRTDECLNIHTHTHTHTIKEIKHRMLLLWCPIPKILE